MKLIKGLGAWCIYNGLFAWAVYAACILGMGVGYNFMVWITGIMFVVSIGGYLGIQALKTQSPEKYQEIRDMYNGQWHINRYIDILYDAGIMGLMVYAGFIGVASFYLVAMFVQHIYIKELKYVSKPTSEEIVSQYDDSILDRLGIDQNERGR